MGRHDAGHDAVGRARTGRRNGDGGLTLRVWLLLALSLLALSLLALPARGQEAPPEPGSELTVYLVTMGQGTMVWERFGHNAIWIRDSARKTDIAYNWGLFDFDEPGFLARFLAGDMRYWMGGFDAAAMIAAYTRDDRSVWAQELRLTSQQKHALRRFVESNALPENRYYRYDYYRDNCSTRVRDAIDRVLGGRIKAATESLATPTTYRWHTRRLLADDLPMYAGTMYGMGEATDVPITVWQEMFLPMRMREHLRGFAVPDESGIMRPLVVSERQLFTSSLGNERTAPPRYLPLFLAFGALLGGALLWIGSRATSRARRASYASLGTLWCVISGVLGSALVLSWFLTDHVFTRWNENVLQLSPLALPLIVLLPRAALAGRGARTVRILAVGAAVLSVLGFVLQLLPGLDQVNGEIIALALPANIGLALGAWWVTRAA